MELCEQLTIKCGPIHHPILHSKWHHDITTLSVDSWSWPYIFTTPTYHSVRIDYHHHSRRDAVVSSLSLYVVRFGPRRFEQHFSSKYTTSTTLQASYGISVVVVYIVHDNNPPQLPATAAAAHIFFKFNLTIYIFCIFADDVDNIAALIDDLLLVGVIIEEHHPLGGRVGSLTRVV